MSKLQNFAKLGVVKRQMWIMFYNPYISKQIEYSEFDLPDYYHRLRWYAALENKALPETFPKFPSILRVIDMSDRNPPITAH